MTDIPHPRRSPLEHERDAQDMIGISAAELAALDQAFAAPSQIAVGTIPADQIEAGTIPLAKIDPGTIPCARI